MLLAGSNRLIVVAAGLFLVIFFGFFVRPSRTNWPTSSAPAAVNTDFLKYNDQSNGDKTDEQIDHHAFETFSQAYQITTSIVAEPTSTTQHASPATETISHNGSGGQSVAADTDLADYNVVSSRMSKDKKYIPIDYGDYGSYNPNLIPHPWKERTWVMIAQGAQQAGEARGIVYSIELVCDAVYKDGKMKCLRSPTTVPIASTVSTKCSGQYELFNMFIGPTDPRVFNGPDKPYITYGSASQYTCLGQFIHDLRRLVQWDELDAADSTKRFFWPTELQRPGSYGPVEKNWFAFWDHADEMYLHYDIYPKRVFAKINHDGSEISEDLAPAVADKDAVCLEKYVPKLGKGEHIHQATNSLKITMCKRTDSRCDVDSNTFIFTIFHHKQYHGHNMYEPYIMMFKQTAPFEVYAISSKPFWINGRLKAGEAGVSEVDVDRPADQTQMMYMTSMSWLAQNMTYHGYLDDELFLSFGIEDRQAGVIDVVAGDLIKDMHLCS